MKRKLLLMLLCAALGLGAAQAEVYRVESEKDCRWIGRRRIRCA